MEHTNLIAIICSHLIKNPLLPYFRFVEESQEPEDSGFVYFCKDCFDKEKWFTETDGWKTMCLNCIDDLFREAIHRREHTN